MHRDKIERLYNDFFAGKTFGDLNPEPQADFIRFANALELQVKTDFEHAAKALGPATEGAMKVLDIMMRTYGAAAAWRDKYKVAKGQEVFALMLVELCNNVMDAIGWHSTGKFDEEPGTVKLVAAPTSPPAEPPCPWVEELEGGL